jgi:hypothetical protein
MRWHQRTLRAMNRTRGTLVGESIRVADSGLTRITAVLELPPGVVESSRTVKGDILEFDRAETVAG